MNDIIFCSEDVIHLINMKGADAVSGFDVFLHEEKNCMYDTWVLRDV